jgi:hypothetical protein
MSKAKIDSRMASEEHNALISLSVENEDSNSEGDVVISNSEIIHLHNVSEELKDYISTIEDPEKRERLWGLAQCISKYCLHKKEQQTEGVFDGDIDI